MNKRFARGEFALIDDFLTGLGSTRSDVVTDIGDDCAITRIPAGFELAFSIDTLVSGVHFFSDCDPVSLGHKSLAVGLSDLAATGAIPAWATLALTLPKPDQIWLQGFSAGLHRLAKTHGLRLVGGDLTQGPLCISIQVMGMIEAGQAILRNGAKPGDAIFVSGTVGDAGLALRQLLTLKSSDILSSSVPAFLLGRLEQPTPRIELGRALRGLASSAIDISDGLLADLGHLLKQSQCGASIELGQLPLSKPVASATLRCDDWMLPLGSGDDYELLFTVPPHQIQTLLSRVALIDCHVTHIGNMTVGNDVQLIQPNGELWNQSNQLAESCGFEHFRTAEIH